MNVVDKELGYVDAELGNFNNSQVLNYTLVCSRKIAGF